MSTVSEISNHVATIDWNIIAAAGATFCGTLVITFLGWSKGKKKVSTYLQTEGQDPQIIGVSIQDNQSLRESTLVNREIRDQLLLHNHALQTSCKATEDNTRCLEDILEELKHLNKR